MFKENQKIKIIRNVNDKLKDGVVGLVGTYIEHKDNSAVIRMKALQSENPGFPILTSPICILLVTEDCVVSNEPEDIIHRDLEELDYLIGNYEQNRDRIKG